MSFFKKIFLINLFLISFLFFKLEFANADAWWGKGAMDRNWVLKHGGSIIYYQIKGKAQSDQYEVKMFLLGKEGAGGDNSNKAKKGDLIETEYGAEAHFDDAINNEYEIKVYKGEKKEISTEITARPGEITRIVFDLYKNKTITTKEIVYRNHQITLTPESAKWVSSSQLKPLQNPANNQIAAERAEKEKQTKLKQEEEELEKKRIEAEIENQRKLKEDFDSLKKEIDLINEELEKRLSLQEKNKKKIFSYLISGPDRDNLEEIRKELEESEKKIKEIEIIESASEERVLIKKEKEEFLNSLEKYSFYFNKNKNDLTFWNRFKSIFNKN